MTLRVERVIELRAVVCDGDEGLHEFGLTCGADVELAHAVAVLVGKHVAEPKRLTSGVVVKGIGRVDDHVAVLWEEVVSEDA